MSRIVLGIDVGGTFTDFVAFDRSNGSLRAWKNLSVAEDPTQGIIDGLAQVDALAEVEQLRLGTTVATNAILERRGARIAYVATRGFRDIPFLQRGNRAFHYDSAWIKPKPLVLRRDCHEVDERITADGTVLEVLDAQSATELAQSIKRSGEIEAVAINLLFSYIEPRHERELRDALTEHLGDIPISISSDVLPKWKEYERASTVIADAYIKPAVTRYLSDMQNRFSSVGLVARPAVIKSNGGEMTPRAAAEQPIHLTLSGPTGGVVAARQISRELDLSHVVTFDMGGTSTDCSTIVDQQINFTTNFEIEFGIPIQIPMIDIRTIGAGGGSIAYIDRGGMLRVGPNSAGARPGPACYGFGGKEATVTDANLVLGRISATNFLGGGMHLDTAAAENALQRLATAIGLDIPQTALAIVRIVNTNMVGALRTVLIERGLDPRDFCLASFGGAGPLHVCDLMLDAGIGRGLVPVHPGQFSALGFIFADPRVDLERTVPMTSARFDAARADEVLAELIAQASAQLRSHDDTADLTVQRSLELRYLGQNYELELDFDFDQFTPANLVRLWKDFHDLHERRYGFAIPAETIEVITFRCTVTMQRQTPRLAELARSGAQAPAVDTRTVWFDSGAQATPVYRRADLEAGTCLSGPALIEEPASVTVLTPGQQLEVTAQGHLLITNPIATSGEIS